MTIQSKTAFFYDRITAQDAIVKAVEKMTPSVVKIRTLRAPTMEELFWQLFSGALGPRPVEGVGSGFIFEHNGRRLIMTNTHVVADAIDVRIDLGFDVWKSERIRLRGVDTPELGTPEGRRAREFVTGTLAGAGTVVVKTYKTDAYARYVADLFHHPALERKEDIFTRGHFLNQQLLDQGLAVKVVY